MLRAEYLFAAHGFAGLVEKSCGIEEGKKIGCSLRAQLRPFDSGALHRRPHHGCMVPHGAREQRRRETAIDASAKVRRRPAALPVDAVTLYTAFGLEECFAALGIAGHHREHGSTSPKR